MSSGLLAPAGAAANSFGWIVAMSDPPADLSPADADDAADDHTTAPEQRTETANKDGIRRIGRACIGELLGSRTTRHNASRSSRTYSPIRRQWSTSTGVRLHFTTYPSHRVSISPPIHLCLVVTSSTPSPWRRRDGVSLRCNTTCRFRSDRRMEIAENGHSIPTERWYRCSGARTR